MVSSKHRIVSCRASWRAFYIQQPLTEVFSDHRRPFHGKEQFEEHRPRLLANELEHDYDQAAECNSKPTTPPPAKNFEHTKIRETRSRIQPPPILNDASSTNDESWDARARMQEMELQEQAV